MSADLLLPVYLLTGTDRPKVGRALARLRARVGDDAIDALDAADTSGTDAVAACNAPGLFGSEEGRLVLVRGIERWKDADAAAIVEYLASPAPGSVLALVADEPLKTKTLAEACAKEGAVLRFNAPRPRDLGTWVREGFARHETPVDADAARALVEICGDDVTALEAEVDKLSAWAGGETVTRADVERLAVAPNEGRGWVLTDAWGARSVESLLAACEAEFERGTDPFIVATRLAAQVALVRNVRRLADEGLGTKEISKRLRKHEFRVRKALATADAYSAQELDAATVKLAALDAALKGSSRLSGELELSRVCIDITSDRAA